MIPFSTKIEEISYPYLISPSSNFKQKVAFYKKTYQGNKNIML